MPTLSRDDAGTASASPHQTGAAALLRAGRSALPAYLGEAGVDPIAIAVTLLGVLLPTVIVPYAYSDDYSQLWMAVSGEPSPRFGDSIMQMSAVNGRPLTGLLAASFFDAAGTIEHLRYIRLFGLLGVIAIALFVHWALVRSAIKPLPAALIAVLICTMPAFQIYAGWTVLFTAPYAALFAGGASVLAASVADRPWQLASRRIAAAVALLLAALFVYQPAAMCFWVFLAIALVGTVYDTRRTLRLVRVHLVVAGAALALAFIELKLTLLYIGTDNPGAARSALSYDVIGRLRWFIEQPLYQSLNLFDLTPSHRMAAVVGVVGLGGMALWLRGRTPRPWLNMIIAVALVPLCYLPNLVITEEWPPFRTQAALSALVALYLGLGAIGIWLWLAEWARPRLRSEIIRGARRLAWLAAVVVVGTSCLVAATNITRLVAQPQMTELRMLRAQVLALPPDVPRVVFVETDLFGGMTDTIAYDEFGIPLAARPWTMGPAVSLILHDAGRLSSAYGGPVMDYYLSGSVEFPPGEPVLDLRGLRSLR